MAPQPLRLRSMQKGFPREAFFMACVMSYVMACLQVASCASLHSTPPHHASLRILKAT